MFSKNGVGAPGAQVGSLDDILNRIVEAVQLTQEQHNRATNLYHEIGDFLAEPGTLLAPFAPEIFPQGSMLLRTTVRPMSFKGEDIEFDLDLVGRLQLDPYDTHSGVLYSLIKRRLEENPEYKRRLKPQKRCLRLEYPEHLFHLDVIPACPDPADKEGIAILIPDKGEWVAKQANRDSYKDTDPLRYAGWFEKQTETNRGLGRLLESKAVAPVPGREPANLKAPLRKIVQLIKRARDLRFIGKECPSSILITTMASGAYSGEESLPNGLENVLCNMNNAIQSALPNRVHVPNPTNAREDFAAAMSNECYNAYAELIEKLYEWVKKVRSAPTGRRNLEPVLQEAMGPSVVAKAFNSMEGALQTASSQGNLGRVVGKGLTILAASKAVADIQPIRPHTFHGEV